MKPIAVALLFGLLLACGSAEPPETASIEEPAPPPAPPRDESHRFPKEGLVKTFVQDRPLGKEFLPPGNVAEYERNGKSYTLFLVSAGDPQAAALLEYDIKDRLTDAKFVASFGGHFGMDGDIPWFVFPKESAVAGVVGLPQDEADAVARIFAGRMD